ncbi:hybrid sensor histidine kinase/response regulator [Novipirellula artificiosorum]|uniref:histidine kinase n=1 Tax=Novipirellula artificiosorum TaxID=2528016 RepID=A0A5C6D1M2_9BACT|nr:hybrid sensor histidine kinase/response regulator [Novipirellula artificiosorum]TWU30822.1 Gliding motility regulatory protein [Novipirellula artificiosorum]
MSGDLSGFSIFELYKGEVDSHLAALSEGLLAIEGDQGDLSEIEQLMRAAHSIKGAAAIADIKMIVELAHTMEDCFVGFQKGVESIESARIDQLLAAVDLIGETTQLSEDELDAWQSSRSDPCLQLSNSLREPARESKPAATQDIAEVEPDPVAKTALQTETTTPVSKELLATQKPLTSSNTPLVESERTSSAQAETAGSESSVERKPEAVTDQRTVPVNAQNLDRIMRLASELIVEARNLQSMQKSLTALREVQSSFSQLLERIGGPGTTTGESDLVRNELQRIHAATDEILQQHAGRLERAIWRSERTSTALYQQVVGSRMRPFVEGTQSFPRMIRDLSKALGKQVSFTVLGQSVAVDRDILRKLEAPLNHLLRNCVDHGIENPEERRTAGKSETGKVTLEARHHAGMLTIEVRDDGRGIDVDSLRDKLVQRNLAARSMAEQFSHAEVFEFLFLPGFSTANEVTEVSGRGVGLDVVRSMVQDVSGTVRVESKLGAGTTFTLRLPVTLSVIRAALAEIAGELYAFPLAKLHRIERVPIGAISPVQGRLQFTLDQTSVGLVRGTEILNLSDNSQAEDSLCVVVIGQVQHLCGIAVDKFIGEQDLVVRPLDPRLGKVPHVSAAAVTEEGDPLLILDVEDLLNSMGQLLGEGRMRGMTSLATHDKKAVPKVLVVDDSIVVRETQRQLLTAMGCEVDVAVDGRDGWHALQAKAYDLVVSDIDMPRMNGIELIRTIRQDPRFVDLPIIIVSYKDRDDDRLQGFEAGANAYLTKGSFHDDSFTRTVTDLIGEMD